MTSESKLYCLRRVIDISICPISMTPVLNTALKMSCVKPFFRKVTINEVIPCQDVELIDLLIYGPENQANNDHHFLERCN